MLCRQPHPDCSLPRHQALSTTIRYTISMFLASWLQVIFELLEDSTPRHTQSCLGTGGTGSHPLRCVFNTHSAGLEQALVVSNGENSNITAQIASYTYQNKSVKVSLHATRLLTDISTTNAVSLYSALGSSTVPLALAFVNRLSSRSQDVYIKSAILVRCCCYSYYYFINVCDC